MWMSSRWIRISLALALVLPAVSLAAPARELGIQLIVGAEFRLEEGIHLILLAPDRSAYGQLSALITKLRRRSPKGTYAACLDDFRWGVDECLALWVAGDGGCVAGIRLVSE